MKCFLIHEQIDTKLSTDLQTVVTGHVVWHPGAELGNQLDNLVDIIQGDNITQRLAIIAKLMTDQKHLQVGDRHNHTNVIHYCKVSTWEIEEFDIEKGWGNRISDRLKYHLYLSNNIA